MKYQILIVEDDKKEASYLRELLLQYEKEHQKEFEIHTFYDGESFLSSYQEADLVFLDINLPGRNGLDIAHELRKKDDLVVLIFVTDLAQFALKGYEVDAYDYMVKPASYTHLSSKLDRLLPRLEKRKEEKEIVLRTGKGIERIYPKEISYVEVRNHTLYYHLSDRTLSVSGTLKKVKEELQGYPFSYCNACYLVNLAHVKSIEGYSLKVDQATLSVSHPRKKRFLEEFNSYLEDNA